jgi:hypothetical protein
MSESPSKYPFNNSSGDFTLPDGLKVHYKISTQGTEAQPVSLTFTPKEGDESKINQNKFCSTLYFDINGDIVDRAPMNTDTNVEALKELYAESLKAHLLDGGDDVDKQIVNEILRGFFAIAGNGVKRSIDLGKEGTQSGIQRLIQTNL